MRCQQHCCLTWWHSQRQRGQVPEHHSSQRCLRHRSLPACPCTHSAGRARRCSFWSRAAPRCSPCHRCGAPGRRTRGCASGCTPCCTLTTCSTPSRRRPLQATKHRHVGTLLSTHFGARAPVLACLAAESCPRPSQGFQSII